MANRFKDSELWSEDWYCDLGGEYMLLWDFITLKCDHAGVWKPNKTDFETKTKFKVSLDSFFVKVNGDKQRILLLENGRWFIPGFISYQWFNKKETFDLVLSNRLHKSIYEILLKNNISLLKVRGLKEVLEPSKDKDKGKEKDKVEEVIGEMKTFLESKLTHDIEAYLQKDQIRFESICMNASKNAAFGKAELRKFHLYYKEKSFYPVAIEAALAGFEKWLINSEKFGSSFNPIKTEINASSNTTKLGTSDGRINKASGW